MTLLPVLLKINQVNKRCSLGHLKGKISAILAMLHNTTSVYIPYSTRIGIYRTIRANTYYLYHHRGASPNEYDRDITAH